MKRLSLVVLLCALTGCSDFSGAYERCVQDGLCVEEGRPSVATSELSVDRTTATADGVETVEVTVVIRDLAGDPVANIPVTLTASGESNVLVQPPVTDAAGTTHGTLSSTRVGQKDLSALVSIDGVETALSQQPWVRFFAGAASPSQSTVAVSPSTLPADGFSQAMVTVTVRDTAGNPVSGQLVTLQSQTPDAELTVGSGPPTDANGVSSVHISGRTIGTVSLAALVGGTTPLDAQAELAFTAAPPVVRRLDAEPVVGGCVPLGYGLHQLQELPTDVVVEFTSDPGPDAVFQRATLAAGGSDGVARLSTSAEGTPHQFLWNSSADLGPRTLDGVRLRLTPSVGSIQGQPSEVEVIVANGASFPTRGEQPLPAGNPRHAALGDLDRDGVEDLVVSHLPVPGDVAMVTASLGRGDGSFDAPLVLRGSAVTQGPVHLAELTGDGLLDVVLRDGTTLKIFKSDPSRSPPLDPNPVSVSMSGVMSDLILADLDRDGRTDAVAVHLASAQVVVALGVNTAAVFSPGQLFSTDLVADTVRAGDLDRDGDLDLLISSTAGSAARVLLKPTGTLVGTSTPVDLGPNPAATQVADLDQDGKLDVAVDANGSLAVSLGNGDGTFAPPVLGGPLNAQVLQAADLDHDGTLDLVGSQRFTRRVTVMRGLGDGTFTLAATEPIEGEANHVVVGDLNRDGRPDLLALSSANAANIFLGAQPQRCDPQLTGAASAPAEEKPSSLVTADFNGDGKLDVAANANVTNTLVVLEGSGSGTFRRGPVLATGDAPNAIAAADVTGDGAPDLLAISPLSSQLVVHRAAGNGTFLLSTRFPVGADPRDLAVADLDGDGDLDVVTTSFDTAQVTVLANEGGGSFALPVASPAGDNPTRIAVGDLDADGVSDLAVSSRTGTLRLLRGLETLMFESVASFNSTSPSDVEIADLDGDGRADLLITDNVENVVRTYLSDGTGAFAQAAVSISAGPVALTTTDLDGDGDLDVVVAHDGDGNNVTLLANDGAGALSIRSATKVGSGLSGVAVGDVQGDGIPDVLTAASNTLTIAALLGSRDGTLRSSLALEVAGAALGDVNRDGWLDVVGGGGTVLGAGGNTFQAPVAGSLSGTTVALADLDRDGVLDRVSLQGSVLQLEHGNGNGTFTQLGINQPVGDYDRVVAVDLNRDRRLDLVVGGAGQNTAEIYLALADGVTFTSSSLSLGKPASAFAVGDVNRDDAPDLVFSVKGSPSGYVLQGIPGGFDPGTALETGLAAATSFLELADVNRDGTLDLLGVSEGGGVNYVEVRPGNGDRTFRPGPRYALGRGTRAITAADLDRDGDLDLVAANATTSDVTVLSNTGDGLFPRTASYALSGGTAEVQVADLNRDGKPDVVTHNQAGASASVLWGR